jgi:hypothetical protein
MRATARNLRSCRKRSRGLPGAAARIVLPLLLCATMCYSASAAAGLPLAGLRSGCFDLALMPTRSTSPNSSATQELRDQAQDAARGFGRFLEQLLCPAAAHASEIEEQMEIPQPPGAFKRLWDSVKDKPLIRRVRSVSSWIVAALRFVWAVPKAIVAGDSAALTEALSGLLARASAADTGAGAAPAPPAPLNPVQDEPAPQDPTGRD